jgi:hypothetical protein
MLLSFNHTETISTAHTLIDEIGGHTFADYTDRYDQHAKNMKIESCSFEPTPYAERKDCRSMDEFMAGIKPYMTE